MAADAGAPRGAGRAALVYNAARAGLLAACLGIGWAIGVPTFPLIIGSLLISGILSWFLLRRPREQLAEAVERTVARGQAKLAARTSAEDGYVEAVQAAQEAQHAAAEVTGPATARADQTS
ncbi:MAG TPA: DUF4229 domain-containing protein [Mycobacteriales bacterium]|nr:DUF4229 domain-containing protein [Mycobacteriales bacterium]